MATRTGQIGLPEITHGELNGDVTHNEGLWITDLHAGGIVEGVQTAEPASPQEGQAWIINGTPTGTNWGTDASINQVAHFYGGIWHYYDPSQGWAFYNKGDALIWQWDGIAWNVYTAGSAPPPTVFQAQVDYPPEGTPLGVAVAADTWTIIPFPTDTTIGPDLSFNGGTYELTYIGANAAFTANVDIIITGGMATSNDYGVRIRNNTQNLTSAEGFNGLTNRVPDTLGIGGNLLDGYNTNDVIVCEIFATHATTLSISGGWYVKREFYL